jgi:hypothetical protein
VKLDDALERVKVRIFDDARASYLLPLTLPGLRSLTCGPLSWTALPLNLASAVEQQRHEGAKVGNKGMLGISPKLEASTWQVNPNHASNFPLPGFFFASSRLCCSPPIAGFWFNWAGAA